jgi:non-ribosomal peptide synthetase component F
LLSSEFYTTFLAQDSRTIFPIGPATPHSITEDSTSTVLVVDAENATYFAIMSGTTGRPKASITEHRSFASCSSSFAVEMHITSEARVLHHEPYSFDPYIVETFSTLIQGACVCIAKDEVRTGINELANAIRDLNVTWAVMTPSPGRLILRDGVPSLKTLVLCGEAMSPNDKTWSESLRLMDVYGPSECSVVSALNNHLTVDSDNNSIGIGVGSRCWIVEPHDHHLLAPVGCVGELLLESPGLARGYINEPDKTAISFIYGPRWLEDISAGSGMYKTGDLVRYNPTTGPDQLHWSQGYAAQSPRSAP